MQPEQLTRVPCGAHNLRVEVWLLWSRFRLENLPTLIFLLVSIINLFLIKINWYFFHLGFGGKYDINCNLLKLYMKTYCTKSQIVRHVY